MRGCDWPENVGEVGDRELGLGQQRQDAQASILASRLEGGVEGLEAKPILVCSHWAHCS